ncbi:hypothetical protein B6D29_01010 [Microgenomates bacterium UTCPR1]|nr:MAG: hypothetical protein B6D29_01010 [Microgenomates bacterium UTCPR1]
MKKYFLAILLVLGSMFFVPQVSADCVGQYGQYGSPCQSYSIVVDKMVGKPGTSNDYNSYEYVDNLSVSDPRFKPDQVVFFKVKIKNTSTTKLSGMEVRDTVPAYLEPLEGPGDYNSATREVVWNAGDFDVDQEKSFYLKMKVSPQASLPSDKGLFCITNFVKASSANAYDDDRSQLCIEKQVVSAKKVPSAGPEMGLFLFTGELFALGTGLFINYKLNKNK